MLSLPPSVRIFIATQSVDGRKGVDSLAAIVRSQFELDPLNGHLYVFFSKRANRVKLIYWDRDGFAMWTKRLELGRYRVPFDAGGTFRAESIEAAELALILEGIELSGAKRRPRWQPRKTSGFPQSNNLTPGHAEKLLSM